MRSGRAGGSLSLSHAHTHTHTSSNNLDDARTRLGLPSGRGRSADSTWRRLAILCYSAILYYGGEIASSIDPDGEEDIKGSLGPLHWGRVGATEDGGVVTSTLRRASMDTD
jgi:hypothetical protein